jgi:sulfatase modifying factor 1
MKLLPLSVLLFVFVACKKEKAENYNDSDTLIQRETLSTPDDTSFGVDNEMVKIIGSSYVPLYGRESQLVSITDFYLDVGPITNSEYLKFVTINKRWRKGQIKNIFADKSYLVHWKNDTALADDMNPESPVTNISWYSAKAYCECQGKRLPTVDEWEYVAMADENLADARLLKSYNQSILDWYETPKSYLNLTKRTDKNYWGVYDLHGLVWEWTSDFNSILLTGESRNDVSTDNNMFCGSGSINATDLMNYAAFMRYAFRGSIKADYSVQNLGFRCVSDSLIINE